jgi:hypothetical protein
MSLYATAQHGAQMNATPSGLLYTTRASQVKTVVARLHPRLGTLSNRRIDRYFRTAAPAKSPEP